MEFCYASILRKDIPLVQHCPEQGNFDLFFQRYVENNKLEPGKTILLADNFLWGILYEEEGLTYICVVKNTNDRNILDKALDDMKSRFIRSHGTDWRKASPFGLQTSFEPQLILVKQSLLSVAGAIVPPSQIDEADEGVSPLVDEEYPSEFESAAENSLIVRIPKMIKPSIAKQEITHIFVWILVFLLCAFIIYFILVLICGGFDLSPRCL
ncbi:hypothetical protein TVAG_023510 [Trichomonas vaginalis G3]|uniref:Longin domain-containing protein n=1 Tax=Trichomonas vaginalis (strain ATCC PRA-98 / G3) TaxID=412133 RepID=A2FEM2_TRIV3|nr:SNAP receptor protein [Trichomonas vaginalis G3]EAX96651.1 hypothetical protein TVAG_023510 [Trichomonas vaginalis G3]KAI5499896.1 SNAP receptor protein [Trichomonas vaginalis G3]|eukprot:XP_001309581.1 hypothetical protein [Trichomonas vaginalis G3]